MGGLSQSAQRVQDALQRQGLELDVVELPSSTRTAADAAQAVGCSVGQIAKSLVFVEANKGDPVLVITSGSNRVDEKMVGGHLGSQIEMARPDFVRERTGFSIGGVSPVGLSESILILIDEDLVQYDEIWAAAGTPNAVFRFSPADLLTLTNGEVIAVH